MCKEAVEACHKAFNKTIKISGIRREVAEHCAVLGYYATSSGNFLPTFRYNLSVPSSGFKNPKEKERDPKDYVGFFNLEDGTDRLCRNAHNKLPLLAA